MLRLTDVRKSFGETVAVDGLTLAVAEGEIFGLLGPNGAGKTTTVGMASGLIAPDAGEISIGGDGGPESPAVRSGIGVAPQSIALYDDLSARENLRFFGSLYALRGPALAKAVDGALEFAGLVERAGHRVKTYSGGMKRRLNLAAATMHEPRLLFLDEPTAGVDPQSRNNLLERIAALPAAGRTVVFTTHYMEEAQRLCDRVGIIDHGKLLAVDTVDGLIAAHGGSSIIRADRGDGAGEIRVETDDAMADLARLHAEGPLVRFAVERPDLEAVFLNLTGRHLRD